MESKPKYLYRGIKLNYDLLHQLQLYGVDIRPHYEPIIDQFGRKTVLDGNEYGVYMTDNITMAKQAYSNVHMMDGTNLRKDLRINVSERPMPLNIPAVGIIYKIDTEGLDVHKPWISSQLTGHYNNGFQGDEWIAESIPSTKYEVIEITIGPDWLHDSQSINVSNINDAEKQVKEIIETRKQHLEILGKQLEKLSPIKRMQLTKQDMLLYRDLFGDDGIKYINSNDIKTNTGIDYTKYLLSIFYKANTEELDYTTLMYIQSLKSRIQKEDSVDKLIEIINIDIASNLEKRKSFVDRKMQTGEIANTIAFDNKHQIYISVLNILLSKKNSMDSNEELLLHTNKDNLQPKVEQEHFTKTEPLKEELINLRDSLKETISEMKARAFEIPNLEDIFDGNEKLEDKEEKVEDIGRKIM